MQNQLIRWTPKEPESMISQDQMLLSYHNHLRSRTHKLRNRTVREMRADVRKDGTQFSIERHTVDDSGIRHS